MLILICIISYIKYKVLSDFVILYLYEFTYTTLSDSGLNNQQALGNWLIDFNIYIGKCKGKCLLIS